MTLTKTAGAFALGTIMFATSAAQAAVGAGQQASQCFVIYKMAAAAPANACLLYTSLSVRLDDASTEASLARGASRLALQRSTDTPDLTRIDLTRVPVQWAAALAAQARPGGRFSQGRLDGRLAITTPRDGAVHVQGCLLYTSRCV